MRKKIFGGIAALAIAATIAFNVNLSNQGNGLSDVSLANVEALAQEGDGIDYNVPDRNNDPKSCSTSIWVEAGVEYAPGKVSAKAGWVTVSGIENTCRKPDSGTVATGCDPYNCHARV